MNEDILMESAVRLARRIDAKAIVSFLKPFDFHSDIPVIWVEELQRDVLRELTMQDILEVSERHILDAAIQIFLSRQFETGAVIGVFPYALLIYDIGEGKDFINVKEYEEIVPRDVMHAVLTLAMEIGVEGREGHPIGTAFIIGDGDAILRHSHQAILNPYQGHDRDSCDIKKRDNWESIKEIAQIDGVFAVNYDGTILAAGRYLDMDASGLKMPGGLGGRHRATAAITRMIPVVGVTISESGGLIRVFMNGECTLTLRSDVKVRIDKK